MISGSYQTFQRRLRSFAKKMFPRRQKPIILMYHRVANDLHDHWHLSVSPTHFRQHLDVLRRTCHVFPIEKFIDRLFKGILPQNAVALTFDDGYVDNLKVAKPLLAAADIPATVFLTTGYVGRSDPFWWDELANLVLLGRWPSNFELVIRGRSITFDLDEESWGSERSSGQEPSLKRRQTALDKIWQTLRIIEDHERETAMAKLRAVLRRGDCAAQLGRVMTADEVRTLVEGGLVTVGAHTVTHPMLSQIGPAACRREIAESKRSCENIIGSLVTAFAYPYGDFDGETRAAVKSAGFAFACSMTRAPATIKSDILALPRLQVRNIDGDEFERAILLVQ